MKISLKNKNNSTWFVVALEEEFSSDKHNVLYTGMGKINAAMSAQWLIDNFDVKKIINVGSAVGTLTDPCMHGFARTAYFICRLRGNRDDFAALSLAKSTACRTCLAKGGRCFKSNGRDKANIKTHHKGAF